MYDVRFTANGKLACETGSQTIAKLVVLAFKAQGIGAFYGQKKEGVDQLSECRCGEVNSSGKPKFCRACSGKQIRRRQRPVIAGAGKTILWIVRRQDGVGVGAARGQNANECIASAMLMMSEICPDMQRARAMFRLTEQPPKQWTYDPGRKTINYGRWAGVKISNMPVETLDRMLTPELKSRDETLYESIRQQLAKNEPEYSRVNDEPYMRDDLDYLANFDPSSARS